MNRLIFLILFPTVVFAQNTIGLPDIINHNKREYKAGLQNWDIKQGANGIVYIANNEGLLSFDGSYWNCLPLPNKTIVRAIEIGTDGVIYAGGQDELGYFSPAKNGTLTYHSLVEKIQSKDRSFGDVWDIIQINRQVFFRTPTKIFKLSGGKMSVYSPNSEWSFLGSAHGKIYAYDFKTGLKVFENNFWVPIASGNQLPSGSIPTAILALNNGKTFISTLKNGLFLLDQQGIKKLKSSNNALFENERIYSATRINNRDIALASTNGGAYIIDENGAIIQTFSKREGLQNNNVLSIFSDKEHNLWLGLDNGIDFIAYNSPIKQINPLLQNASGYTATVFQNEFWIGTSNGLYSVPLQNTPDLSFSKGTFSLVKNTKGQTWNLTKMNNELLLGHHEGAFTIQNHQARLLADGKGYWTFLALSSTMPSTEFIAGTYAGLVSFSANKGIKKEQDPVGTFKESSRFMTLDEEGTIWVSHPYHGVFRIERKPNGQIATTSYSTQKGLPSGMNNHVFKINAQILLGTTKGVYEYDQKTDRFRPSAFFKKLIGDQSVRYLKEDEQGNIWFVHEKTVGVIDVAGAKPRLIYLPELNGKLLSGFEHIYAHNAKNILIGGEKGFFIVNYEKYKSNIPKLLVNIRSVKISNPTDSILYGGYRTTLQPTGAQKRSINQQWKSIRFEFSSALFGSQSTLEYSYRLKGFDNSWSAWTERTEKEFTTLAPGNYTFEVKVRNNLGNESPISVFRFEVLPPWYLSWWAKGGYAVLFYLGVLFLHRWYKRKLRLQQARHEDEQKKLQYIHELERAKTESELLNLRNEKLETEITLMNTELASAAMHLVKKGEVLAKSKEELSKALKVIDHPQAISELKKMLRNLNEDEKMDQEWDNFSKHFDKVHSDFLLALKEKHPSISANELKLCAYLRMNLSTKEIAQLTNISVRGVEISRYRLRKKLELPAETRLFDYLIAFKH